MEGIAREKELREKRRETERDGKEGKVGKRKRGKRQGEGCVWELKRFTSGFFPECPGEWVVNKARLERVAVGPCRKGHVPMEGDRYLCDAH